MSTDLEIDLLATTFARLQTKDELRRSQKMAMPALDLVTLFEKLATRRMNRSMGGSYLVRKRRIVSIYGVPPEVMAKLWELILKHVEELPVGLEYKHLLWTLHKLKVYSNEADMSSGVAAADEKTFRKWTGLMCGIIAGLKDDVIVWENRKIDDVYNDCLMSVDCTDCPFQQILVPNPNKPGRKMRNKALYSYKLNGPALRYEVGLALATNDIVWVSGPYAPGDWNDIEIFRQGLVHMLEPGERVEADPGYIAEAPQHVKCFGSMGVSEDEEEMRKKVEARIETVNQRLKHFSCLKIKYKGTRAAPEEKMRKHGEMFMSCTVITQIALELGFKELYDLEEYD